jgi:hypothetical protein
MLPVVERGLGLYRSVGGGGCGVVRHRIRNDELVGYGPVGGIVCAVSIGRTMAGEMGYYKVEISVERRQRIIDEEREQVGRQTFHLQEVEVEDESENDHRDANQSIH